MSRNRKSAKKAGSSFERLVADYLKTVLGADIDRQVKTGNKDQGDIRGLYVNGKKIVLECKDYGGKHELPQWLLEAETERGNADAEYGAVCWKRRGVSAASKQYLTMELETFAAIIAGGHDLLEEE